MKLFRDKNRGPKIKSEDVVIPEEYLEYEREAEARKRREVHEESAVSVQESTEEESDPIAIRVEQLLSTSKKTLQEQAAQKEKPIPDVTIGEVVDTLEEMLPSKEETADATSDDEEMISLEEALQAEKQRSNRAAKKARRQPKKKESAKKGERAAAKASDDDLPTGFKVLLISIMLIVAAVVVLLGPLMKIDNVQVNDLKNMSEAQVEEIAGNPVGQNLFFYRTSKAEEELRYYPYVQDVTITRHFPHWIEINITEREPAGVLLNNGSYLQFSKDGVLLNSAKSLTNLNLPLITGFSMDEVPSPGEAFKDNERFSDILKIVNACPDELLSMIQEINIKDRNNILAYTSQGIEIRIGNVDNIESRMATLNDIMNQVILSNIIEEPIEAIDIRYEKSPVVVLEGYDNIDVSEYLDEDEDNKDQSSTDDSTTSENDTTSADNNKTSSTSKNNGDASTAERQTTAAANDDDTSSSQTTTTSNGNTSDNTTE